MATKRIHATEQYNDFLRSLEVVAVGLKSCSTSIDRDAYFALPGRKGKAVKRFAAEYKLNCAADEFFDAQGEFKLTVSDPAKSATPLRIDFTLEAHLHAKPPIHKEFAHRFTEAALGVILLPFARSFVSDITARMTIPPIMVPLGIGTPASRSPKKEV